MKFVGDCGGGDLGGVVVRFGRGDVGFNVGEGGGGGIG